MASIRASSADGEMNRVEKNVFGLSDPGVARPSSTVSHRTVRVRGTVAA